MPPFEQTRDALLYMVLPALAVAAIVMATLSLLGGVKQSAAAAALGLIAGAIVGLWMRDAAPLIKDDKLWEALLAFRDALTLIGGDSAWNRLPWAILAALCVGRLAYLADVHSSDGWLLRGGTAIGIAGWLIPEMTRTEFVWTVPALAAIIGANWVLLDRLATLPGSSSAALSIILTLVVAGGVLLHAGIARFMDVTVVLAVAFTGVALVAFWRGVEIGGTIPAIAVALPALLLMGNRETSVETIHWAAFALPALAPLMLAVTLPCSNWPKILLHLVRLVLVLIPLVIALVLAQQGGPLDFGGEGGH